MRRLVQDRPVVLSVAFWLSVTATLARSAVMFGREPDMPFGLPVVAPVLALTVACWSLVPWHPRAGRRRKAFAVVFLVMVTVTVIVDGHGLAAPMLMVAMANIMILFGIRWAVALAAGALAPMYATINLIYGRPWEGLFLQAIQIGLIGTFVFGIAAAVTTARRSQERAQGLLAELESAHAELERYADEIGELTVARERARMARDMHDSVGHYLTIITVGLRNAERFREKRPQSAWDEVLQARKLTEEALAETRRWVRALRPLALDGAVGTAALDALAKSFEGTGIAVHLEVQGTERPLDSGTELVLYRVLQEGLVNAVRHGNASSASARLVFGDDRVVLEIGDNGRGGAQPTPDAGFGLSSLSERARSVGGTLTAQPRSEGGFMLRADLPSPAPAPD